MMEAITLDIDGRTVEAAGGTTLLEAARANGIEIPTHCHDENLRPYGGCRLCMVEITRGGRKRLVAACLYEVEQGLEVHTRSSRIDRIRRMIIELTWPNMREYAEEYGAEADRFGNENTDCALCGKCVRFCAESRLGDIVYFKGRGIQRDIDLTPGRDFDYDVYMQCMSFCPGGRLMNRIVKLWEE
jgi:NADH dehydrogenase/NADH:ubiquinone oxidoreductase subunit G